MQKGFTLIETLVYLAIFAFMMTGLLAAASTLFASSDRNQAKAMLQEESNFLINKMIYALDAKSICGPALGSSGDTLTLMNSGVACSFPYSVTIATSSSDIYLNTSTNILNNSNVTVNRLRFVHSGTVSGPESVEIDLDISARMQNGMIISNSASTTRYIRK